QPPHRLDVLREHVEARGDDRLDVREIAGKVGRQRLDGGFRAARLDRANARGVVAGAAVGQVVAVDRRQHDVLQVHELDGPRRVLGLVGVEPAARVARVDGAELTRARADVAHQHDRGRAVRPALADVRAHRLLADGREPVRAHRGAQLLVALARRDARLEPRRLRRARPRAAVGAVLDAVADGREALLGAVLLARDDANAAELAHAPDEHLGVYCVWPGSIACFARMSVFATTR